MTTKPKSPPTPPATPATKSSPFKQTLRKQQPWQFGGQTPKSAQGGSVKATADAERLAGKNRKVH